MMRELFGDGVTVAKNKLKNLMAIVTHEDLETNMY